MKKIILSYILLLFAALANAQEENKVYVDSKAESAIVYLNGAEVEQNGSVSLLKGNNLIIFRGISPFLNSKSIRVSSNTELSILSISTKINYLTKKNELPLIKKLNDSLTVAEESMKAFKDELDAFTVEKDMVISNKDLGGNTNGVAVNDLKQGADFFRQRILDINKSISKLDKRITEYSDLVERYKNELKETNTRSSYSESEIQILVSTEVGGASNIKLQYMVSNAGWVPCYEIKADDLSQPIQLVYKAKVFNNTAIAWNNIHLKLSIADPTVSITKPDLRPWYLGYYSAYNQEKKVNLGYLQNKISNDNPIQEFQANQSEIYAPENYEELDIPDLSTEFEIKSAYSIPADDKPYMIDIEKYSLPATYKHFAVTKLDKGVFLLGRISGWQDLSLVDGYANVYYKGTYLGESLIKTRDVKDTLDLSLGRDDKVLVTRTKLKEFSSKVLIGTKLKETLSFELVARNNRKNPVDIDILDQVPISTNSEIEVKVEELSGGAFNPVTGEVKWKYNLKPTEAKKIILTFSIKYPKNQTVEVEMMKQRAVRKF